MIRPLAFLTTVCALYTLLSTGCSDLSSRPRLKHQPAQWETIFFKEISRVTELARIEELRDVHVRKNDIELRIWRGFSLSTLEGIQLKRMDGIWSATHLVAVGIDEITAVKKRDVVPRSSWDDLWQKLEGLGILELPDYLSTSCTNKGTDRVAHVVEINRNNSYRTYLYIDLECPEGEKMDEIANVLGLEFDPGTEGCETAEWLPCARVIRERKEIESETEAKGSRE